MASPGVGGRAGSYRPDHGFGHARTHLCQPRRAQGRKLVGVGILVRGPECVVRHKPYAAGHQSAHSGEPRHRAYRPLRLRQIHLRALPQPHARDQPHRPRDRHRQDGRRRHLQGRLAGRDSPPRRHGLPASQSLSNDVDLRQCHQRPQAQRLSQPPHPRRNGRALAQTGRAVGRGQGRPQEEIRRQPLRRPAAAHVHRPRPRRRPRGVC